MQRRQQALTLALVLHPLGLLRGLALGQGLVGVLQRGIESQPQGLAGGSAQAVQLAPAPTQGVDGLGMGLQVELGCVGQRGVGRGGGGAGQHLGLGGQVVAGTAAAPLLPALQAQVFGLQRACTLQQAVARRQCRAARQGLVKGLQLLLQGAQMAISQRGLGLLQALVQGLKLGRRPGRHRCGRTPRGAHGGAGRRLSWLALQRGQPLVEHGRPGGLADGRQLRPRRQGCCVVRRHLRRRQGGGGRRRVGSGISVGRADGGGRVGGFSFGGFSVDGFSVDGDRQRSRRRLDGCALSHHRSRRLGRLGRLRRVRRHQPLQPGLQRLGVLHCCLQRACQGWVQGRCGAVVQQRLQRVTSGAQGAEVWRVGGRAVQQGLARHLQRRQALTRALGVALGALLQLGLRLRQAAQGLAHLGETLDQWRVQQGQVERGPVAVQHHQVVDRHQALTGQGLGTEQQGLAAGQRFTLQHGGLEAALGQLMHPAVFVAEGNLGLPQGVLGDQRLHRRLAQAQHRAVLRHLQQRGVIAQCRLPARRPGGLVLLGLLGPGIGLALGLVGRGRGCGLGRGLGGLGGGLGGRRGLGSKGTAVL